jgi:NTE family protein
VIEVYGVFEGGGVRGTALVGAIAAAEKKGIGFRAVAGTSAGAIVASLIAAGYKAEEMRTLLTETDFKKFMDPVSRVPLWNKYASWRRLGLYKGDEFHCWIAEKISVKLTGQRHNSPTFEKMPIPLTVIAADILRQQVKVFSRRRTPDVAVADAVRMSMSIPLFFCPVRLGEEVIVDGGVLSNFPAWAFEEERKTAPLPILGFRLQPDDVPSQKIRSPWGLIKALTDTVIRANIPLQIGHLNGLRVIDLPTLGVRTTDFNLEEKKKDELYQVGHLAALAALAEIIPDFINNAAGSNETGAREIAREIDSDARTRGDRVRDLPLPAPAVAPEAPQTANDNPFSFVGRVNRIEDFFDRDYERESLRSYLTNGMCCQIVGPRRIGKSSLLYHLPAFASEWGMNLAIAYLDLLSPRNRTAGGLLEMIGEKWRCSAPLRSLTDLEERVNEINARGSRPVLCLDEFKELARRPEEFSSDFFLDLRGLAQQGMVILATARKPLCELVPGYTPASPFFNIFPILRLGPFAEKDAEDFVTLRRAAAPPFTPEEKRAILEFAKGYPAALQIACFHVLQAKRGGANLSDAMARAEDEMKTNLGSV